MTKGQRQDSANSLHIDAHFRRGLFVVVLLHHLLLMKCTPRSGARSEDIGPLRISDR